MTIFFLKKLIFLKKWGRPKSLGLPRPEDSPKGCLRRRPLRLGGWSPARARRLARPGCADVTRGHGRWSPCMPKPHSLASSLPTVAPWLSHLRLSEVDPNAGRHFSPCVDRLLHRAPMAVIMVCFSPRGL